MKVKIIFIMFFFSAISLAQDNLGLNLELHNKYPLFNNVEMSMVQSANGSKTNTYSRADVSSIYEVTEKNDSAMVLEIEMKDIIFLMSSPYIHIYFDSEDRPSPNENILNKLFRAMIGLKYSISMNKSGKIISSNFSKVMLPLIMSVIKSQNVPLKNNDLNSYENNLKQIAPDKNLEIITNFLPLHDVNIGDVWKSEGKITSGIPLVYKRDTSYKGSTDSTVILESISALKSFDPPSDEKMFEDIFYKLKGEGHYKLILDKKSKWFNSVEGQMDLSGIMYGIINQSDTIKIPTQLIFKQHYGATKN